MHLVTVMGASGIFSVVWYICVPTDVCHLDVVVGLYSEDPNDL